MFFTKAHNDSEIKKIGSLPLTLSQALRSNYENLKTSKMKTIPQDNSTSKHSHFNGFYRFTHQKILDQNRYETFKSIHYFIPLTCLIFLFITTLTQNNIINAFQPNPSSTTTNQQQQVSNFPGISRELSSFCAARPSLPIDLAAMIVHVKRNVSFNYKLYLFSADNVFQTGQVIPRDDFRIHSFPVKFKPLNQFWPETVPTYQYKNSKLDSLVQVPSDTFKLKQFMKPVALNPDSSKSEGSDEGKRKIQLVKRGKLSRRQPKSIIQVKEKSPSLPEDASARPLPGDEHFNKESLSINNNHHEGREEEEEEENLNKNIHFDRDDQVSSVLRRAVYNEFHSYDHLDYLQPPTTTNSESTTDTETNNETIQLQAKKVQQFSGDLIIPVGSFSSFHVNITYLVRKEFDQKEPQIIRTQIDANKFQLTNLHIISNGTQEPSSYPNNEDYNFLSHKLLRDLNTRITSINQIYEDWITRNFYTIVYIQRRLDLSASNDNENKDEIVSSNGENHNDDGIEIETSRSKDNNNEDNNKGSTIVNDRLIFRGTSTSLLGADQLDYTVKAAAFITEKNGLHYYLEFLPNGKFHLAAVDWTKRPFKIIDSRRFPIKATKTLLDNEELLLCPPAVCYSNQPIDEVVSFGRIPLSQKVQKETLILSSSFTSQSTSITTPIGIITSSSNNNIVGFKQPLISLNETSLIFKKKATDNSLISNRTDLARDGRDVSSTMTTESNGQQVPGTTSDTISLDNVIEEVKLASIQLQTRLHLRDWVWILPRINSASPTSTTTRQLLKGDKLTQQQQQQQHSHSKGSKFEWRYELARRNDIKAKPDTYGYVLTGHEIDASYRIYNELYLISANYLITINYTKADETSVSTHPIGDEFLGLTSTLLDPITGSFYDRYSNQIYFFKGDRYIGYDYATKKPLEDFVLRETTSTGGNNYLMDLFFQDQSMAGPPLVSSLPVVDILGKQHQVDGVYHDLATDLVYIFSGMKFYTFEATEFKNGSFKSESQILPQMLCINENFLHGCNFDVAFPNPCQVNDDKNGKLELLASKDKDSTLTSEKANENEYSTSLKNKINFNNEQQMKLRSIATKTGLLNFLVENSLLNDGASRSIINATPLGSDYQPQEKIVFYLLTAMVALTVVLIIVVIVIVVNWARVKMTKNQSQNQQQQSDKDINQAADSRGHHYLTNQYHHSRRPHHQRSSHRSSSRLRDSTKPATPGPVSVVVSKSSRRQSSNIDNSVL